MYNNQCGNEILLIYTENEAAYKTLTENVNKQKNNKKKFLELNIPNIQRA
jgi:hypothetical protein